MRKFIDSITASRQYPQMGAGGEDLIQAFAAEVGPSIQEMASAPAGVRAHLADVQDILLLGAMLVTVARDRRDRGLVVGEELSRCAKEAQHLFGAVARAPHGRD